MDNQRMITDDTIEIVLNENIEAKTLIFVLHGYGANKEDILPIGEYFSSGFDDAMVCVPNAIDKCDDGHGYQWFSYKDNDIKNLEHAFDDSYLKTKEYITKVIASKKMPLDRVVLSGFSQGGMVSLAVGLEIGVGAIVSFSGMLMRNRHIPENSKTKVFMAHGGLDFVISIEEAYNTKERLEKAGVEVKLLAESIVQHRISAEAAQASMRFLKRFF